MPRIGSDSGVNAMLFVPLEVLPNQTFSIQIDNHNYDMAVYSCNLIMAFDLVRDGVTILTGQRVVVGTPVIPYEYLENENGNFAFVTANEEYPDYLQFNTTQSLIYASNDELEVLRDAGT
jgi:hypothetical protein